MIISVIEVLVCPFLSFDPKITFFLEDKRGINV